MTELKVQYAVGDALAELRVLPDNSVDSIVTDPPYGLSKEPDPIEVLTHWLAGDDYVHRGGGFMGKTWDSFVPGPSVWKECLRVLKPGGHLLCFAGTRTVDLMGISIRLGGFEIRDEISWVYGSGFPKSMDVSKAIDKMNGQLPWATFAPVFAAAVQASGMTYTAIDTHLGVQAPGSSSCYWARTDHRGGLPARHHWEVLRDLLSLDSELDRLYDAAEREVLSYKERSGRPPQFMWGDEDGQRWEVSDPSTPEAREWEGWGTALKPAHEPIIVARKPLGERTVAANVLTHGTGALNIDATRIGTTDKLGGGAEGETRPDQKGNEGWTRPWMEDPEAQAAHAERVRANVQKAEGLGRWPANFVLSHSEGCELAGTKTVKSQNPVYVTEGAGQPGYHGGGSGREVNNGIGHGDEDGNETVEAWTCVPGCPIAELDSQSGPKMHGAGIAREEIREGEPTGMFGLVGGGHRFGDQGGASRFFYNAKASKAERNAGMPDGVKNTHPTVKPVALMRWLVRMVTPPGGTVLDPYLGSGTTAVACVYEGFSFMGIDKTEEYITEIAVHRVRYARAHAADPIPVAKTPRSPKAEVVPSAPAPERRSPKIPETETKTVQCGRCQKDVETSIHWNGTVVCRDCLQQKVGA